MSYYFHKSNFSIDADPNFGIRVSNPIVIVLAPILGAFFLVFMPFIGFYLLGEMIVKRSYGAIAPLLDSPPIVGEAHFTGKRSDDALSGTIDDSLDKLSKEIQSRRKSQP